MTEDRPDDDLPDQHDDAEVETIRAFLRSEPVAPVDEVTRRRMLQTAMEEAGPDVSTRGRWWSGPRLLAVAAAVVVVVAAGAVIATRGGGGDESPPLAGATDLPALRRAYLGDAGTIDAARVRAVLAEPGTAALDRREPLPESSLRCAAAAAGDRPVVAVLRGEYQGDDAYVFRVREPAGDVALVVATDDCRLLDRVELGN